MELFAITGGDKTGATPDVGPGWGDIIGERKLVEGVFADFGMAEECVGFLSFDDDTYEVGVGEALRPFLKVYSGPSREEASTAFVERVFNLQLARKHADDDDEFEDGAYVDEGENDDL